MTNIDQFESIFRSASKPSFEMQETNIRSMLVLTDKHAAESDEFAGQVSTFLQAIQGPDGLQATTISGDDFGSVHELLEKVESHSPDLICTYRNLKTPATEHPYSLGVFVDVLTQATHVPTLLFPRPELIAAAEISPLADGTRHVMVVTDHLAGDHLLVSMAARFVSDGGELVLSHIEDEQTFNRYIAAIDKIADIDSEIARETIMNQLLSEPRDYIESCRAVLNEQGVKFSIEPLVTVGRKLNDYRKLIEERHIDLLIMHTKDEEQLAMHGVAYPLAIELRSTPLLLL